jgi:DNA polymerase/3'-5' exonuclease PolX
MSGGMNYGEGMAIAAALANEIKPFIVRGAVAGSLRRGKQEGVKDIELCLIPRWEDTPDPSDMFGEKTVATNLLHGWAMRSDCPVQWIKTGTPDVIPWQPKAEGKYWRGILKDSGAKLDVFIASPENWGAIYLIRTGSAEFTTEVMTRALRIGCRFRGGHLWAGNRRIPVPSEEGVFRRLGIRWVDPAERHGKSAVVIGPTGPAPKILPSPS